MKRFLPLAVFFFAMLMSAGSATAATGISGIVAHYKIYKSGILIGTVEEKMSRDGDNYRIVSETQTAGALKWILRDQVTLTATGKIGPRGLETSTYELRRQGDASKNVSAIFDRDKNQILSRRHDKTELFDLPRGTLDRISAMYQFAFGASLAPEVIFWMSQGKEAEQYRYRRQGEANIKVGDTTFPTVHYVRESAPGKPQAELWLATNKNLLPVRMIFEDSRGLELEQMLVDLQVQ